MPVLLPSISNVNSVAVPPSRSTVYVSMPNQTTSYKYPVSHYEQADHTEVLDTGTGGVSSGYSNSGYTGSGYTGSGPPAAKGVELDDSNGGNHRSVSGGANSALSANKDWSMKYRRRRKDEESGGGGGSTRSSISSVGTNTTTAHNKVSPASPNQSNLSRNDSTSSSSGNQVTGGGTRGGASTAHQTQVVQTSSHQHFDLEASSFPPLPVPDQPVASLGQSAAANKHLSSSMGSNKTVDSITDDAPVRNAIIGAPAWGENRLADVVKGTAKTTKSSKSTVVVPPVATVTATPAPVHATVPAVESSATDKITIGGHMVDENNIPIVSATANAHQQPIPPASSSNNNTTTPSIQSAKKSSAHESGDESNVISMAKPSQRHDSSTTFNQQQHQMQRTEPSLANSTDVTANSARLPNNVAVAPTYSPDMSNMVPHPNMKNNPVIKHLNAEISTKTDGSLVNGIDDSSDNPALVNSTETIAATASNVSARNIASTTRNAATMTTGADITVTTASTMTAFVTKPTNIQPAANNVTTATKVSAPKPSQLNASTAQKLNIVVANSSQSSSNAAAPLLSGAQPQSPTAQITTSIAAPSSSLSAATPSFAAAVSADSHTVPARLSYAQVAQHNKERLSQEHSLNDFSSNEKSTDKVEYKRKDLSPNSINTHVHELRDRSGNNNLHSLIAHNHNQSYSK